MKFKVKQPLLRKELEYLQSVVERKSTIPVLSNILIEAIDDKTLKITGTDLDVTMQLNCEADISETGEICVQAHKLFDIVKLLPDAEISFESEENHWTKVKCNKSKFRLAGVSRDNFPEVPQLKAMPLKFPARLLNLFIQNTFYSITEEASQFTLGCAKLLVDANKVTMVTTDGHRLSYIERDFQNSGSIDALVPKKALKEVQKLIGTFDGEAKFGEDPNHVFFEIDGRTLVTRKLSGKFPNYEMVIPKGNDSKCVFDVNEMKMAVRRVTLMSDERTYALKVEFKTGEIHLSAQASEEGEATEVIYADYNGEDAKVSFNSKYLLQFLNTVSDELFAGGKVPVTFKVNDTGVIQSQMLFTTEDEKLKHVIMPLRF